MGIWILLIEDEDDIADFIVRGLREEGYTVERQPDGNGGLLALSTSTWDIVLLDWWLPGINGLDLLRHIRQEGNVTPVIFLTARDAVSDRVKGLDQGANDYLCKPFAFEELLARIRALIRRPAITFNTTLKWSNIVFYQTNNRAERAGNRLDLKAKEQALLVFFLRHPEEVLSRPRIYEQVWGDQFDGMSNTIDVHVSELRRKLEAFGPRVIHTLRGQGYILSETDSS